MPYKRCPRCRRLIPDRAWSSHWNAHLDRERERKGGSRRTRNLRELILARDNHACVECGATEELEMHHIDGNWRNDNPSNLQMLCVTCHGRAKIG